MANANQDTPQSGDFPHPGPQCAQCELMLADVLDGTLSAEEQAGFDLHVATCTACSQMLADAQRGAAWLELLRTPRPEPPAALLEQILAQTAGQTYTSRSAALAVASDMQAGVGGTAPRPATVLPFRSRVTHAFRRNSFAHALLQPRLAMTAAMAFFSIGLTLNLTGVRLNELRLVNLRPANVRRSFYQADAHLVRYYTNLRVVYELESRVRDLQRSSESDVPSGSDPAVDQQKKPAEDPKDKPTRPPGAGTSRRQSRRDRETWDVAVLDPQSCRRTPLSFARHAQEGELV